MGSTTHGLALRMAVGLLMLTHIFALAESKRVFNSNSKKTSSRDHVTHPTYSSKTSGGSGANTDLTRLSYANSASAPAPKTPSNAAPIGWNVPKQQGPPPAYSPTNPVGGAKTNIHEAPPAYGAASNVHSPITATNTHSVQSGYPSSGGTYHSPAALPAGATYYPSGHPPAGATYHSPSSLPAGATYYPAGHSPMGGASYPSYGGAAPHYPQQAPAGATYYSSSAALPPGATYYSQPPQSSSGLGFGSGLAAGAIGGAILGHVLTPSHSSAPAVAAAPAGTSSGGEDRIIIINNGPPGSVTATEGAAGATVITTGGVAAVANATAPQPAADAPAALAPMVPAVGMNPAENNTTPIAEQQPPPVPAPGSIICVPMRVNETDPADPTKMVEVENIACYPAPPPPPPAANGTDSMPAAAPNTDGPAPLAPMAPLPGQPSQPVQQTPLLPDNTSMRTADGGSGVQSYAKASISLTLSTALLALVASFGCQH